MYSSLDDMLPDVDVVDICPPTHLHHEMALKAAAAEKHVVCEKPLARTAEQAKEIAAMNPCPCGYFQSDTKPCTCALAKVTKYQKRISGSLLDRIDTA